MNPEMMQQMMQMFGGGGLGGAAPAAAPADNRPPEERYAEQLRQLNDMGFFDFDRNVEALRRSGGSVQGAIEHLLSG
jgi:ubiquilin